MQYIILRKKSLGKNQVEILELLLFERMYAQNVTPHHTRPALLWAVLPTASILFPSPPTSLIFNSLSLSHTHTTHTKWLPNASCYWC